MTSADKTTLHKTCPVIRAVAVIGSKWKLLIMRELMLRESRFGELMRSLGGISHKMLTQSLRELEADGIVLRNEISKRPLAVSYSLTEKGRSLKPVFDALRAWGENNCPM